ncbi:MAG TPA: gliding motility-associated C-terminal domain-containing protein, partial [Saprospiraceae bacterium]|nr:gliding motility-associated C-terminal domain-containing protein [Saprospiraceae bacterium]
QSLSGPGINYLWSGPGILPGQQTSPTPTVNAPGLYTLTVSNTNNGCSKTDVVTVNQDLIPPIADAGQDQILTCASTNGVTISAAASSIGAGYTLQWSGPGIDMNNQGQTSPTVTVQGSYTVLITSLANGCTASDDVFVDQDQNLPTANAGADQIITCNDPQAVLDGTGSTTGGTIQFLWSGPGINANNQGQISPNVSVGGSYTLVVTNTQTNCQATDNVVVTLDNQPPSVTLTSDTLTCADPQGTLTVTSSAANSTFLWQGVDINPGNQDDAVVTVDQPGLYTVTVTPPNGCTVVESIVMEVDANFPQGTAEGTELNCGNDGTSTIGGSVNTPNATFEWTGPGNFFSTDPNPTVTAPGNYTFTIIASNGCEHDINVVVTADFAAPIASANVPEFIDCNTLEVSIFGSGSSIGPEFTYQWTTTDGNIVSGANGLQPLVDAPGAYTLLVTDLDNGCTNTTTVSVQNDPEVPTGFDLSLKDIRCFGETSGVIEVNSVIGGTAPFEFTLTDANGDAVPGYTNLASGEYTISLLDANGCTIDTTVSINSPEQLLVSLGDDISIQLGEDVTVAAEIVNDANVPVASWSWNPLAHCDTTCLEYTWQPTATYRQRITVVDENGCEASDEVLVIVRKDRLVYVPSVFDPESDDPANALLSIYTGLGVSKVRKWLIFDRWGDAVFQVDEYQPVPSNVPDPAFAWNGKVRGEKVTPGVYVWYAEIEFADGVVEIFKGDVTLLRNK